MGAAVEEAKKKVEDTAEGAVEDTTKEAEEAAKKVLPKKEAGKSG